jgi:hypothetical protein
LATLKAGFEFGTTLLGWLMTDEGKAFARKSMEDRAAWDKFWKDAADGLKSLFTGQLFK